MFELTLNGPGKNALGMDMLTFVVERLRDANGRPVLLTGSNDAFSAGLNIRELASLDAEGIVDFLRLFERCMAALYTYPGPTVACVNGHAIAGGAILALCCDRRVIAPNPKIKVGLNEVALGVRFPPRALAIVTARIPRRHHIEVLLGAGMHGPEDAVRLGFVDEVADETLAVARDRLAALAAHPAAAYAATKRDLHGTDESLCPRNVQERVLAESVGFWTSPALRAKFAALLQK